MRALDVAPPERKQDLPRFAKNVVIGLWSGERHPRFVRFMFVVRLESKQNRSFIQRVFEERLYLGFTLPANAFGRDDQESKELRSVIWLVTYSLGLACLEQRALFGTKRLSQGLLEQAEWVGGRGSRAAAALTQV